jgi:exopolysaccharide production protein ExoZ
MQTPARDTVQNVQVLRALAALFAVLAHLQYYIQEIFGIAVPLGGVDLFFVISGFVMVYTTTGRPPSPRKFMAARIVRVVPLYWAATIGVFLLAFVAPRLVHATSPDVSQLIKSLLFIPFEKESGLVQPTLFVGWTLNYEIAFYILFAIGLMLRDRMATYGFVIFALVLFAGVGVFANPKDVLGNFYFHTIQLNFVFGMVCGLIMPYLPRTPPRIGAWPVLAMATVAFLCATMLPAIWWEIPSMLTCGLPSAILVAAVLALERWGWRVTAPWAILLGDATYSIYLTHPFVTGAMQKATSSLDLGIFGASAFVLVSLVAAALVGIATYKWIELPLNAMAKKIRLPGAPAPRARLATAGN